MTRQGLVLAVAMCAIVAPLSAQYRARRGPAPTSPASAGAYKGLIVSFHGAVKKLTKKELLLQSDEDQLITLRCTKQTKFFNGEKQIKRSDIDLDTPVTVDASEDTDLKMMAVAIKVDSAQKKNSLKP